MKNKALLLAVIGALMFGLLAAISVSNFLANTRANNKLNTIVVAKVEIPLGAKIVAEQLTTVQTPQNATPDGTFDDPAKVLGRVTATRILPREAIINSRLAGAGAIAGLSAIIPEGYRAMTVKVDDETGISGFVMPGALVDVLAVINTNGEVVSKIILQNIKVLANGDNLDEPGDKREAKSVRTVTLLVTPAQSEKLTLASADGKLRLAMRSSVDQGDEQTSGASRRTLLTGERAVLVPEVSPSPVRNPAPRPAQSRARARLDLPLAGIAPPVAAPVKPSASVEVFEGMKKRSVEFP